MISESKLLDRRILKNGDKSDQSLLWMLVLMAQIWTRGLTAQNNTRMMCLSLFWHFLDIVWICVFTVVYLMGAL